MPRPKHPLLASALALFLAGCGPTEPVYERLWIGMWHDYEAYVCGRSVEGDIDCWSPDSLPFSEIPGADVDVTYRAFDIESDLGCGVTEDGVPLCWGFDGASVLADTTLDSLVAVVSQVNAVTWIAADGRAERLRIDRSAASGPPFESTREIFAWFDVEPPAGGADLQCDTGTCWGAGGWAELSTAEYVSITASAYFDRDSMVCGLRLDGSGECTASYHGAMMQRWSYDGPVSVLNASGSAASVPAVLDEDGRRVDPDGTRYSDEERYANLINSHHFVCGAPRDGGLRCAYGVATGTIPEALLPLDEFVWSWDDLGYDNGAP